MSVYLGDYAEDYPTLNFKFTTMTAAEVPTIFAGTPLLKVYEGSATGTEIDTGVTLAIDFDGITGLNNVLIDLSSAAFYATGADYSIVVTQGTVNGVSWVGRVLATFSIENRAAATLISAGFPQNITADVEPGGGVITTGTNTANDGDSTWANDGSYWQVAATTAVGGFGLNMYQVFTLGTTARPSTLKINAKETLAGVVHVWLYDYDAAAWEQVSDTNTAISGNADADYTYIINPRHQQTSDGEVQVRYTSVDTNAAKYLYLDHVYIQAVALSDITVADIAQGVWEADLATIHGAFVNSAGHTLQDTFAVVTTVATGDTTTSFTLTAGQASNDCYNGMVITIEDATDSHYESRRIADYTSGRVVTVDRAFSFTPAAGDHAEIVNISYADVNVTHLAASAIQQASGYIKVSAGTGTGQISLASGLVTLAAAGLNNISVAEMTGLATTWPQMVQALYQADYYQSTLTGTQLKRYKADGVTVISTQTVSDTAGTQTLEKAT